jgi:hypothetical protein
MARESFFRTGASLSTGLIIAFSQSIYDDGWKTLDEACQPPPVPLSPLGRDIGATPSGEGSPLTSAALASIAYSGLCGR